MTMSVILKLGAINTALSYPCLVTEETEYDPNVDMSPVAEDLYSFPSQTYPGCFGLPYQDHNYGAPPPPTPPQSPVQMVTVTTKEDNEEKEEMIVTDDEPIQQQTNIMTPDPLQDDVDDPTRCICDFIHDDGYMIQCDKCSVWQHIVCMGLDRDSIPDVYFCELCNPRQVDRNRAREFQIRKREFLKTLVVKSHDSSTDTDPEEVNNRLRAYGLDQSALSKQKQKMKLKKRKERNNSKNNRRFKSKDVKVEKIEKVEKENASNEANRKSKLLVKDFSSKTAQARKEKLSKKIEKMRAERLSKETKEDAFSSDDHKDDKPINVITPVHDENAQNPWGVSEFNEWEQNYEAAKYNQYTTYVQEYLNSTCINGHHNDIADLVTDGLRAQRCHVKELKNRRKCLEASCNISNGQPVIEVIGKVMTRQQYDKDNFGQRHLSPFVFFYGTVFDLELVIDSSDYGNDARFIRRSCQSNATIHHVVAGGQAHFIAVSTKEIPEHAEITIPYDYDYKKWNFCFECACLRNNCPVSRYQKRRLRFQKMQRESSPKKYNKQGIVNVPQFTVKPPIKSPLKSPVESPVKAPEKPNLEWTITPTPEPINVSPSLPSPNKMVRRSQVSRQNSSNLSNQVSGARTCSIQVHAHNKEESSVFEPLTIPMSSMLRSSEVDHLTSPEITKECTKNPVGQDALEMPKNEEKRKLTREERKMEAIMKAFEEMEKRNQRKVSVEQPQKPKEKDQIKEKEEKDQKKDAKKEKEKQVKAEVPVCVPVKVEAPNSDNQKIIEVCSPEKLHVTSNPEPVIKEPLIIEVKKEMVEEKIEEKPALIQKEKNVSKKKKARRTGGRRWVMSYTSKKRRTRNSSGTTSSDTHTESQEENSNGLPAVLVASCPATPAPIIESGFTPAFKFLKTKRHLMNEWLSEKSSDPKPSCKSEPLEVSVEEENMFVTCLPSPRNSMDRFRRNSQSAGSRDRHTAILMESNVGSAKKRWLRQAIGEGSDSGMSSPVSFLGSTSPNPHVATMCSPGGSPPIDFVTPLKKRRLARECVPNESQSMPPTPVAQSATSYFGSMSDTLESFRTRNGFSTLFSPIRPPDIEMEVTTASEQTTNESSEKAASDSECDTACIESQIQQPVHSDHHGDNLSETSISFSAENTGNFSSCSPMDCNVASNVGTDVCLARAGGQISNLDKINYSAMVECEQTSVCDQQEKSASSEPDSSDSVCKNLETQTETVCDGGSNMVNPVAVLDTSGEVDSTESSTASNALPTDKMEGKQSDVNQCDSCTSEKMDSPRKRKSVTPGPSSVSDKLCSSTSSSLVLNNIFLKRLLFDRLSQVDSSTDQLTNSETGALDLDVHSDSTSNVVTSENSQHHVIPDRLSFDNEEVSNSFFHTDSDIFTVLQNGAGNSSLSDSFSATNSSSDVVTSTPNRHLKFLNDNSYSTDMTVDSTTQYMPSLGANNLISNSGLPIIPSYDSDSADVTSASETVMSSAMLEEARRNGEDSLTGYSDFASSTSSETSHSAKKKVSLQEYLKRKKEKTSASSTSTTPQSLSSSSPTMMSELSTFNVSSTTKKSPLKLSSLISLEKLDQKLPRLPSLPSLPMFEKTEHREFKSSSNLLSPIFNCKEKQEEVRKQMSLSERLRQEFGLDDCTDHDADTEGKLDHFAKGTLKQQDTGDVPPPPPPPPQTSALRLSARTTSSNNPISSLLSIKTCPPQMKTPMENASVTLASLVATQQVPQPGLPTRAVRSLIDGVGNASTAIPQHNSQLQSPRQNTLGTLLSTNKTPQQLQDDLTAQLQAIKAQISKVQLSQPLSSSLASLGENSNTTSDVTESLNVVQVFDYGHQSNSSFMRQNSNPGSSTNFQNFSTLSPHTYSQSPNFNKVSAGNSNVSPSAGNQSLNGTVTLSYSTQVDGTSPSSWTPKHNNAPSNRKQFNKQLSHKY